MHKLALLILIGIHTQIMGQNPIDKVNQQIEFELSTSTGRLGAFKQLLLEIQSDGIITPEDFYLLAQWQKKMYDSVDDDFNIKSTLEPKFQLLTATLQDELLKRYSQLKVEGKEDLIKSELENFNSKLRNIAGEEYVINLEPGQLEEFVKYYDSLVDRMDIPGIVKMVEQFTNH